MKSTTLIQLVTLPAILASLLGVNIVAGPRYYGLRVIAEKESADQTKTVFLPDKAIRPSRSGASKTTTGPHSVTT
jgi:hypothetical protein